MSYIGSEQPFNRPVFRFNFRMAGKGPGKNLFSDFSEEPESEDAIKVFLRLKPNTSNKGDSIMEVLDSRTLLFKTPSEFIQTRKKLNLPDQYKYTFSKIFKSDVTQGDIFRGCVAQHVRDLFAGQHCLLFTYGTTNAGKTYTVLGNGDNPGIIPRTLTTVFKTIRNRQFENSRITPHMFNSALELTDKSLSEETNFKHRILNWVPDKSQTEVSRMGKSLTTTASRNSIDEILDDPVFKQMQSRLTNESIEIEFESEPEDRFSVWISFAEIYNEAIYDLLQQTSINKKRVQLKISRDNCKNYYIKGLKHVCVQNEEEAYKVLRFGKNNLQVAATGINSNSSRSHCIFSIKLLKCSNVENPEKVVVSSFSICDLAGAERQKKTLNDGLRLKESQNINSSLMVLSRCFSVIRENQMANDQKLVPFRESKLTQLFQHALIGKESVTMIVNVNPEQYLYEETQHVLKASAIAKHIVVQQRAQRPPRSIRHSSFSQLVMMNRKKRSTMIRWDSCIKPKAPDGHSLETILDSDIKEMSVLEKKQEQYEDLLILIDSLKEQIKGEKEKVLQIKKEWRKREDEIRDEMKTEFNSLLNKNKAQLELDQRRLLQIKEEPRRKNSEEEYPTTTGKKEKMDYDNISLSPDLKDLQVELKIQQSEIDGLTSLVELFKEEKKELTMDLTSVKMQLTFKEKEIENLKKKIELFGEEGDMNAAYLQLEEKLKEKNTLLEEAQADFLDELAIRDEHEEEIEKLQKEISRKDEKINDLISKIEDMNVEIDSKTRALDMLEKNLDDVEEDLEEARKRGEVSESLKDQLAKENQTLQEQLEKILLEKKTSDEKFIQCQKEFDAHKQETSVLIESLSCNKKTDESINYEEREKDLIRQLEEEYDKRVTEVIINMTEENELRIEDLKKELDKSEVEDKLSETLKLLECERESKNNILEELKLAKENLNQVQEELAENGRKVSELEQFLELQLDKKDTENQRLTSEIALLEQDLKQQIQETTKLWNSQKEKQFEIEKLVNEHNKCKTAIESLSKTLRTKEHDMECIKSELVGYQSSMPTLKTSFMRQQQETSEYKRKCEDLMETIINMEKEQSSFQCNQKEIIGKYEDQLKKTKDENDTLKKEVARVTSAFYKSTPTPKKDLEKEIESLKKQLEEARFKLEEEKENSVFKVKCAKEANKENESVFEDQKESCEEQTKHLHKFVERLTRSDAECRARAQSATDQTSTITEVDREKKTAKSASKMRLRKTTRAPAVPHVEITDVDSEIKKPTKQARKKLWDASTHDETSIQLDNVEFGTNVPQDSPGTIVKRNLRSRHK